MTNAVMILAEVYVYETPFLLMEGSGSGHRTFQRVTARHTHGAHTYDRQLPEREDELAGLHPSLLRRLSLYRFCRRCRAALCPTCFWNGCPVLSWLFTAAEIRGHVLYVSPIFILNTKNLASKATGAHIIVCLRLVSAAHNPSSASWPYSRIQYHRSHNDCASSSPSVRSSSCEHHPHNNRPASLFVHCFRSSSFSLKVC